MNAQVEGPTGERLALAPHAADREAHLEARDLASRNVDEPHQPIVPLGVGREREHRVHPGLEELDQDQPELGRAEAGDREAAGQGLLPERGRHRRGPRQGRVQQDDVDPPLQRGALDGIEVRRLDAHHVLAPEKGSLQLLAEIVVGDDHGVDHAGPPSSSSRSQAAFEASLGMRQSPRGERLTEPTLGPSGATERLNWLSKNRSRKTRSQRRRVGSS